LWDSEISVEVVSYRIRSFYADEELDIVVGR
jgi:hypothetical protein